MKTKALYIIFISLAILSVLLMAINKQCNYVINDWYISGIYIAMWFFLFLHTVGKTLEGKRKEINTYIPSILTFLAFLLNVIYVFCLKP